MMDETGGDTVNVTDIKTSHEINLFESLATYQKIIFIFLLCIVVLFIEQSLK